MTNLLTQCHVHCAHIDKVLRDQAFYLPLVISKSPSLLQHALLCKL